MKGKEMALSNNEKQLRYRKKEELKRYADNIFKDWQILKGLDTSRTPKEVRTYLDSIVNLHSGWTADDYNRALKTLQNFHTEFYYGNRYLLKNDVQDARNSIEEFITSSNPKQWLLDAKKATFNMQKLSAHIISALDLAEGQASDNAAAISEVMRHVGRILLNEKNVPKSNATAMCLASISSQFERPDWLVEQLVQVLATQLGKELAHKLGKSLMEFK
jgi:hypothetical protein